MVGLNKSLIKHRFSKAVSTYNQEATAQRQIAEKMITLLLENTTLPCNKLFEIGCGTGLFSKLLIEHLQPNQMILNDICPEMEMFVQPLFKKNYSFLSGDIETISLPKKIDLIASCSVFQWLENLVRFFERCQAALAENGILAFSTFGKENMCEIKKMTGIGLKYPSLQEIKKSLENAGFDILYSEEECMEHYFETPRQVLYHLKQTGVTGIETRPWTFQELRRFEKEYQHRYGKKEGIPLTYHPMYIIAKKRAK